MKKFDSGRFDFLGLAKFLVPLTLLLMLFGSFQILFKGLNYGIDFSGGTEIQVKFNQKVDTGKVRDQMAALGFEQAGVQSFGEGDEIMVRVQTVLGKDEKETAELQKAMVAKITEGLTNTFKEQAPEVRRVDSVGPAVGEELKRNSILATFYSLILLLIYIGLRFDYKYAPGAIFCVFHDALMTLSIFAIFGLEVNIQTMASILTLIGYSLNDTIVTFDRIRENEHIYEDAKFSDIVNRSVNDVLGRTILTSFATLLAVASLYFFSDGVIQQIAFTLGVGIFLGAYSTIYIAAPLVIMMDKVLEKRARTRVQTAKA